MNDYLVHINNFHWLGILFICLKIMSTIFLLLMTFISGIFALKLSVHTALEFFTNISLVFATYLARESLHKKLAQESIQRNFDNNTIAKVHKQTTRSKLERDLRESYHDTKTQ